MQVGETLGGTYKLLAVIGRGGMGEVFRAIDLRDQSEVAIKVVSRSTLGDLLMARLEREAIAASRIQSQFVPRFVAMGHSEEGEFYMVMELLHGESLSERMKREGGIIPWQDVHAIGGYALAGLIDAHEAGVIHRDLKPGNVFLENHSDGTMGAKVLDFGVCKVDVHDAEKLTVTGESVGTIAYMAPEQIRGASRVDGRADLYSFAMVAFEMMSGRLPFEAQGQMALLASKLEKAPLRLSAVMATELPVGLDDLLALTLSRDPDLRPRDAREMLSLWRTLGSENHRGIQQLPAVSNPPTQTALSSSTNPALQQKRSRLLAMSVGAGTGLAIAALIVLLVSQSRTHEGDTTGLSPEEKQGEADPQPPEPPRTDPPALVLPAVVTTQAQTPVAKPPIAPTGNGKFQDPMHPTGSEPRMSKPPVTYTPVPRPKPAATATTTTIVDKPRY